MSVKTHPCPECKEIARCMGVKEDMYVFRCTGCGLIFSVHQEKLSYEADEEK